MSVEVTGEGVENVAGAFQSTIHRLQLWGECSPSLSTEPHKRYSTMPKRPTTNEEGLPDPKKPRNQDLEETAKVRGEIGETGEYINS